MWGSMEACIDTQVGVDECTSVRAGVRAGWGSWEGGRGRWDPLMGKGSMEVWDIMLQ